MKKSFIKTIIIMIAAVLSFLMPCHTVYADENDSGSDQGTKTYTYSTGGKDKAWKKVNDTTWTMDINGDGKADVTLKSSTDSSGDTVWTYTFNVEDDQQKYYVYEAMKGADDTGGLKEGYTSSGSEKPDVKRALEADPGTVDPETHSYTITNTKKHSPNQTVETGSLKIEKSVNGYQRNSEQEFSFTIQLDGGNSSDLRNKISGTKIFGDIPFQNGTAVIALKNGGSRIISDLPAGLNYTVTERAVDGYTVDPNHTDGTDKGTIVKDQESDSIWENISNNEPPVERDTESWYLEKKVNNPADISEEDKTYHFLVSLQNLDPDKDYSITDTEGNQTWKTFRSRDDGSADVNLDLSENQIVQFDVPVGSQYQVAELAGKKYISSYEVTDRNGLNQINSASGANTEKNKQLATANETVDANEDVTVTFTNTYPAVQSLNIQEYMGHRENGSVITDSDGSKEFTVNVHFSNIPSGTVIDSSVGAVTPDEYGEADKTFTLKADGSTANFNGIPADVQYWVSQDASDYKPTYAITTNDSYGNPVKGDIVSPSGEGKLNEALSTSTEPMEALEAGQNDLVTFVNLPAVNFGILKKDKDEKQIAGAEYDLQRYDGNAKPVSLGIRTTDQDGFAGWTAVEDGIYILKETKPADGYTIGSDYVFRLTDGKAKYCTSENNSLEDAKKISESTVIPAFMKDWTSSEHTAAGLNYLVFPVLEGKLVKLPSTGGIGLYLIAFIALILIAIGLFLNKKGRKTAAMILLAALAAGTIGTDTVVHAEDEKYGVTVHLQSGESPVSGGTFAIQKVANLDIQRQTYTAVSPFDSLNPDFANTSDENYAGLAENMVSLAAAQDTQTTGSDGKAEFTDLDAGMYLVWQTDRSEGAVNYEEASPVLVSVPNWNGKQWDKNVSIYAKTQPAYVRGTVTGQKKWKDEGNESRRPDSIVLHLISDGKEVAETRASAKDNWKFSFENVRILNDQGKMPVYTVTEDPVDGYTLSVDKVKYADDGSTAEITATNTYQPKPGVQTGDRGIARYAVLFAAACAAACVIYRKKK